MRMRKRVLAIVVCGVAILVVNMFTPPSIQKLAGGYFKNTREVNLVQYHLLAMLANAILLATIYPSGYRGRSPIEEGARFGVLMALIVALPDALHKYAMINSPPADMFLPVAWSVLKYGVAGVAVALVYGRDLYVDSVPA